MLIINTKSKKTTLITILLIIFPAEIVVMGILFLIEVDSPIFESIVDGMLLAIISAPFIYYFLIKDITNKNANLVDSLVQQKAAEDALLSSQKELRRLSNKLINSEEDQRKNIAFELHDSIGQSIFSIKLGIENMLKKHSDTINKEVKSNLHDQLVKLQLASEEVRHIAMNLRPSMIDDLGILSTIKWFVREFKELYPEVVFEINLELEEEDIPNHLRIVVFRIIQESLNNMGKYSEANNAKIGLCINGDKIVLIVSDDGKGFNMESCLLDEGLGLTSMKERAHLTQGEFSLKTKPSAGTVIQVEWQALVG
ncbi:MAG: histidine kinase [Kangiellaceae bacterium]|nr:histidine kinase [Kangiellaceae bacterium]